MAQIKLDFKSEVERYCVYEIKIICKDYFENPFNIDISCNFIGKSESVTVDGFYDGNNTFKFRFMPRFIGEYEFSFCGEMFYDFEELNGKFLVTKANSKKGNHGSVSVANTYHFAYSDGTPYYSVGTTCYVWELQSDELIEKTLENLKKSRFNKIRFCIFPKHYDYNFKNPRSFPYEGTPMDYKQLTKENFFQFTGKTEGNNWDFERFNPEHFQHIEKCILKLSELGIEADIIVMHPYDRWGFNQMTREQDTKYWKYVIARLAAYRNVWWSLANEYDLCQTKTLEDWEHYAEIISEKDPYNRLTSIHNCYPFYDHNKPWITHCSIQRNEPYLSAEYTKKWRETYKKPIVLDEICYEGNVPYGWGNISGEELVRRFWEATIRGGYAGHGETYINDEEILWWSHGGNLRGESWKRFGFLLDILKETPGIGLMPYGDRWDCNMATPESEKLFPIKSYYLMYFSFMRPAFRDIYIDDNTEFEVEIIDTWNMTIEKQGTKKGNFRVTLPSKEYMAIRLRKI